ncbi:MAG: C40 family peptidase [Bdellovibrionales bacterium]|nr:C40 family peptidase [Bdellovibrionales bacterium]
MKPNQFIFALSSVAFTLFVSCPTLAQQAAPSDLCQEFTAGCQIKKIAVKGPMDTEDQYALDVTVGALTEAQFNSLYTRYATKPTKAFDARHAYKLAEFLPAFAQKLNGKILIPHSVPAPAALIQALRAQGKKAANIAMVDGNCHSVSWQWVNYLQGRGTEEALLTLADGESMSLDASVDYKDIQPGDVLVISGTGGFNQDGSVLHSAVYLGHGLMFEKPNPGQEYVYRMSYLADIVGKYKKVDAQAEFHFYRPSKNSHLLPTLTEQLSLVSDQNQKAMSVNLSSVPAAILSTHILQESWDNAKGESVFTLGRILKASEVNPAKFKNVGP